MTVSQFRIYDNEQLFFASTKIDASGLERFRQSGVLTQTRTYDVQDEGGLRVVAAAREGATLRVALEYTNRTELYDVTQGRPLSIETQADSQVDNFELVNITIGPGPGFSSVDCVVLIHEGSGKPPAVLPTDPAMIMNASVGVTRDVVTNRVSSWIDARILGSFSAFDEVGGTGPLYVDQHPDFNDRPVILFDQERMEYSGAAIDWENMDGSDDFTLCMVVSFADQGEVGKSPTAFSTLLTPGGFEVGVDGGQRPRLQHWDETSTPDGSIQQGVETANTPAEATNGTPGALVVRYTVDDKKLRLYYQGYETVVTITGTGGLGVGLPSLGGNSGDNPLRGAIADIRYYARAISDEERDTYNDFAVSEYNAAADRGTLLNVPASGLVHMLRTNRGVTLGPSDDVDTWADTRSDATKGAMTTPGNDCPIVTLGDASNRLGITCDSSLGYYLQGAAIAEFDILAGAADYTWMMVIQYVGDGAGTYFAGNSDNTASGATGSHMRLRDVANRLAAIQVNIDNPEEDNTTAEAPIGSTLPLDRPTTLVGRRTPNDAVVLAIDGRDFVGEGTNSGDLGPAAVAAIRDFELGRAGGDGGQKFYLLEHRIYDRKLTDEEVADWELYVTERYRSGV